jgi:hypothetical protein
VAIWTTARRFGDGDDAGVDGAQREVGVAGDEFDDPGPVLLGEVLEPDLVAGHRPQEAGFGRRAEPGLDQPGTLDGDRNGNDELASPVGQEVVAGAVVGVVLVGGGEEDPGVDQDHVRGPLKRLWRSWRRRPGG